MRKLCAYVILAALFGAAHAAAEAPETAYEPVFAMLEAGLAGDEAVLESDGFNVSIRQCCLYSDAEPQESVGFAYDDLDGDGSEELLIGETEALEPDGFLFEIWTLRDGRPVSLAQGWERNRLFTTWSDGVFGLYREGSNSAYESVWQRGRIEDGGVVWQTLLVNLEKAERWTLDGKKIAKKKAESLLRQWQKDVCHPALTPLAERGENEARLGFTDEKTPRAEGAASYTFRLTPDGPEVDVTIADTGRRNGPGAKRDCVLEVTAAARDGSFSQRFEYAGDELPGQTECMAWFDDMNFDGFRDLVLLTARGVYNEFSVFCLWNPEESRFGPVTVLAPFDPAAGRFGEPAPLELVSYGLQKPAGGRPGRITSFNRDGYAANTTEVFGWESGGREPALLYVYDVYDAGDGRIGDRLYEFMSQGSLLWDQIYPEGWYYAESGGGQDRRAGARAVMDGKTGVKRVSGAGWVNLRERDSKKSASLARLPAGTEVRVLKEDCADGWTLVLWDTGEPQAHWFGSRTVTGYVRHGYLK